MRGEFWERDHSATLSSDSSGKYEWSAIFHKGNRMSYSSFITESYIDTANVFHKKGEKFTDSTYSYSIKNNVLKVTKRNDSYFLRLIPKDTNVFEIVSVRESEFNN
ncbi:MAG: hypothetical protein K0S12_146 [Bacteroidetes bacterium]|nr:hypothetical protein [Bacteroidota bacterium]